MDIAAASMAMSQGNIQLEAGMAVARKAMDQQEVIAEGLLKMMEGVSVAPPPSEHIIDIKV